MGPKDLPSLMLLGYARFARVQQNVNAHTRKFLNIFYGSQKFWPNSQCKTHVHAKIHGNDTWSILNHVIMIVNKTVRWKKSNSKENTCHEVIMADFLWKS